MSVNDNRTAQMNAKMAKIAPELASSYATYPLRRDRWSYPSESDPNGKPCYVGGEKGANRPDYVHGIGPEGGGYYHLLTRTSYSILYSRLRNEAPSGCSCSKAARQQYSDFDDVKTIVYNRSVASKPDDAQAAKDAIAIAQGKAAGVYNATQNEQLVVGAVMLAT